jgi:core-2/I-Branching enzyme
MPRVPIAYLIRAHHRPHQLARLIDRLRTPNARFFVHISARTSDETYAAMRVAVGDAADVRWLPRVRTYYGGFSLVRATLIGIDAILREEPRPDHAVVLSGQDYPLRPAAEIEHYFAARPGISFLEHFRLPAADRWLGENGGLDRIRRYYLEWFSYRTRLLRVPLIRRRFPAGLTPYGGSAWCALAANALVEIDRFAKENARALAFFRHVKISDEIVVPTIVMNSPVRDSVVNEEIHHLHWPGGAHPATFTRRDLDRLMASGKLFARKFDLHVDEEVLDLLDREALQLNVAPTA